MNVVNVCVSAPHNSEILANGSQSARFFCTEKENQFEKKEENRINAVYTQHRAQPLSTVESDVAVFSGWTILEFIVLRNGFFVCAYIPTRPDQSIQFPMY